LVDPDELDGLAEFALIIEEVIIVGKVLHVQADSKR